MTAPTGLGQYNKPQGSQGDRVQAQQMVDRPMLVWVRRTEWKNKTRFNENGGTAVFVDILDLSNNAVYIEVMWMAGAIVDGLKQYAGDGCAYPVQIVKVQGGAHGSYNDLKSLGDDPQWMSYIGQHLGTFQNLVAQTRAAKEQEWATAMRQQPPGPPGMPQPPAASPMTPAQVAAPNSQAGYYDQAMAMQPPHVQQALQQPPAPPAQPPAASPQQWQQPAAAALPQQPAQDPAFQFQGRDGQMHTAQPAQQPAQDPAYAAYLAQQAQQQPQYQAPAYSPPAAVSPPQYQQAAPAQAPAAPPGPPAAGPPQQWQQPTAQAGPPGPPPGAQYGAPPAAPTGLPGLPTPPGQVTSQTVDQLQAQLAKLG